MQPTTSRGRWARALRSFTLPVVLSGIAFASAAQDYPTRTIKLISGFTPGTSTDLIARVIGNELQQNLGQPVIIDQKVGAAGNIAAEFVARSDPDGYTLLPSAFQLTVTPWLQKLKYDVGRDFVPVIQTAQSTYVLTVNAKVPASNLEEFIAYAKRRNGELNFGSPGLGTGAHLGMVMLQNASGFRAKHIPYKGTPDYQRALVAGEIDMAVDGGPAVVENVRAGKIKAIAIFGLPDPALPGVKSINDVYPDLQIEAWHGLFAPAGTPPQVVNKLAAEVTKILAQPQTRSWFLERGYRLVNSTPEIFRAKVNADLARYKKVVEDNKLQVE